MRNLFLMLGVVMLVSVLSAGAFAADSSHGNISESLSEAPAAVPVAPEAVKAEEGVIADPAVEPVMVGNKICPVSKDPVNEMGKPYEIVYNGKTYNLCCEMCAKEFMKDPEKYSKIADDEVKDQAVEAPAQ